MEFKKNHREREAARAEATGRERTGGKPAGTGSCESESSSRNRRRRERQKDKKRPSAIRTPGLFYLVNAILVVDRTTYNIEQLRGDSLLATLVVL